MCVVCVQVHPCWRLPAAQLLADLLQDHQQHSAAAAHPAHTTEAAPQGGPPQAGKWNQPVAALRYAAELILTAACLSSTPPEQHGQVGEAAEQECRH